MDLQYLKKLMKIFDESSAENLTIEEEGTKLKMSKNSQKDSGSNGNMPVINFTGSMPQQGAQQSTAAPVQQQSTPATPSEQDSAASNNSGGLHEVKSPIVGTFYRAPSPDSDPFVEVGDRVKKGQTLCIVEAMKLMNEIEADADGVIDKILLEDSEPVEFDQTLFLIKPD